MADIYIVINYEISILVSRELLPISPRANVLKEIVVPSLRALIEN
jgi:hypothetical protein